MKSPATRYLFFTVFVSGMTTPAVSLPGSRLLSNVNRAVCDGMIPAMLARETKYLIAIIAVLLGLIAPPPRTAWACSCAMPGTPAQEFAQREAVFVGEVTGVRGAVSPSVAPWLFQISRYFQGYQPPYGRVVSWRVIDSWKGVNTTTVDVQTGYGDADCGYGFQMGQTYLLYAYRGDAQSAVGNGWGTNICSRTTEIANATTDLLYLQSQPKLALTPAPASFWPLICAGSLALAFGAVAGAFVWLRRRKSRLSSAETGS
ncbi:MAG: hypothetical protein ACT4QE_13710 [Anaerolineales bacterium]